MKAKKPTSPPKPTESGGATRIPASEAAAMFNPQFNSKDIFAAITENGTLCIYTHYVEKEWKGQTYIVFYRGPMIAGMYLRYQIEIQDIPGTEFLPPEFQ